MQVHDVSCTSAFQEGIYILGEEYGPLPLLLYTPGMPIMGEGRLTFDKPVCIESVHQFPILPPGEPVAHVLDAMTFPKPSVSSKHIQATVLRKPCATEDDHPGLLSMSVPVAFRGEVRMIDIEHAASLGFHLFLSTESRVFFSCDRMGRMEKTTLSPEISAVVFVLDKFPLIEQATVFGSLLTNPQAAGDVDIAFVINAPMPDNGLDPYRRVLRAGAYGTPRYGYLDVFLDFQDALWVRNDDCLGFVRAKGARDLRKAIARGVSWSDWRPGVVLADEGPRPQVARKLSP